MEMRGSLTHRYLTFATEAADSPCFADWARGVAGDPEVLDWLGALPPIKQQPNLVFAAARWHGAPAPGPYEGFRGTLLSRPDEVRATILARATQTNEVGRLATLVPLLARVEQEAGEPLALVEAGASAGLCLFPDRYDYRWPGAGSLQDGRGPVLTAEVEGPVPIPSRHPEVAWRAGCDLSPVDVSDPDQRAWLEVLVWPEQQERRERLRAAMEVARQDPPQVRRGDLLELLPGLVEEAGRHGVPVLFHSAVIAYLDDADRARFAELAADLVARGRCRWVSNEGATVLPEVSATGPVPPPGHPGFVLALDGRSVAWTHGHGQAIRWW